MNLLNIAEQEFAVHQEYPGFKAGDTVTVHYKIKEGDKERIQMFRGVVYSVVVKELRQRLLFAKFLVALVLKGFSRSFHLSSTRLK
jgi:ribosomal protein L19